MKVIFIRHGQTEWNKCKKLQGQTDINLDMIGRQQAQHIKSRVEKLEVDLIFSSPLQRACETLGPLIEKKSWGVIYSKALIERNFGCLQGLNLTDKKKKNKKKLDILRKTVDPDYAPPGGESLNDIKSRVLSFLSFLKLLSGPKVVVCMTHGGILDIIYRLAAEIPINSPRRWHIPNAGVFEISLDSKNFKIVSWADVGHLRELTSLDEFR